MKRSPLKRGAGLARGTALPRKRMARTRPLPRDWTGARAKVAAEGRCRVCDSPDGLQAAHTIGREHDRPQRPGGPLIVDQLDVVALCGECHAEYDARRLDLMPYLTRLEMAAAVRHVGIVAAVRRLSGGAAAVTDRAAA